MELLSFLIVAAILGYGFWELWTDLPEQREKKAKKERERIREELEDEDDERFLVSLKLKDDLMDFIEAGPDTVRTTNPMIWASIKRQMEDMQKFRVIMKKKIYDYQEWKYFSQEMSGTSLGNVRDHYYNDWVFRINLLTELFELAELENADQSELQESLKRYKNIDWHKL